MAADPDLETAVRRWIASSPAVGHPPIAQAAKASGLSPRTLQRRLSDVGLSYKQLLDEARMETALHLLEQTEASMAKIGLALGYANPANFTRAFERWTGETPSAVRRRHRRANGC